MTIANRYFAGDDLLPNEIGVEIEVEGRNLPEPPMGWRGEHDGSLRGYSCEYVFRKPVPRAAVDKLLTRLSDRFEEEGAEVYDSGRAGVHVHVNIRDLTETELWNFITLYLCFEDALVDWCGKDRVGNLFCLRTRDAEDLLFSLEAAAATQDLKILHTNNVRYGALNCKAILDYGSLEFRSMRSTVDKKLLTTWINMLLCLKDHAKEYQSPTEIVSKMSWEGGLGFAKKVFGDMLSCFGEVDWEEVVVSGIRRAQPIVFAKNWENVA